MIAELSKPTDLTIIDIPVDQIEVHPINDREDIDSSEIESLAASLRHDGQLTPCLVRPIAGDRYQLIYGSRRFRATKLAGLPTLRAEVRAVDDQTAFELIGVENIHRREFNPIELALYLDRLVSPIHDGGAGLESNYVAERFGKSQSWVSTMRRLLRLPDFWQGLVANGKLTMELGKVLIPHVRKEPVMKAVEASYRKNPAAWSHKEAFIDQLQFIVHRFEKLQQASPGVSASPATRKVEEASPDPQIATSNLEREKQSERHTNTLIADLDAVTESVEAMPKVPLSTEQAKAMLQKHWSEPDDLMLIRKQITQRLNDLRG